MKPLKKRKRMSLGDEFSSRIVCVNGVEISVDENGNAVIRGDGDISVQTTGKVFAKGFAIAFREGDNTRLEHLLPPKKEEKLSSAPASVAQGDQQCAIGSALPDGWVVMGISPDTGQVFSAEPADEVLRGNHTWHQGEGLAKLLRTVGHENARQPSRGELSVIYNNIIKAGRNACAQFNTNDIYWSGVGVRADAEGDLAWCLDLNDGRGNFQKECHRAVGRVRCVRDEPHLKLMK